MSGSALVPCSSPVDKGVQARGELIHLLNYLLLVLVIFLKFKLDSFKLYKSRINKRVVALFFRA